MKRLVIFDLDGTLVDSEDFIVWSFVEAGRLVGVEVDPGVVMQSIGMPLEDVVSRVLNSVGVSRDVVRELVSVRKRLVNENWRKMVKLFPDVEPALRELSKMNLTMAVASSSVTERIIEFLDYFGVLGYFKVVSGMKPGLKGKPEPDVILEVLLKTGIPPLEAIYVGDREVDCVAASGAGVDFVLVDRQTKYFTREVVCKPLVTIKALTELPDIITAINLFEK